MIYMEPGNRRADTMTIVSERCAWRDSKTGEFRLVAKACGYLELVLANLAEFYDAGVIEDVPGDCAAPLRWTKTGHYLWKQWQQGLPRAIVELPKIEPDGGTVPAASKQMLTDAGWETPNTWKISDGWVAEVFRDKDDTWQQKVLLLDARGLAYRGLSLADAAALAAAILAAAR